MSARQPDRELTPGQKGARTRAANKAAERAKVKADLARHNALVKPIREQEHKELRATKAKEPAAPSAPPPVEITLIRGDTITPTPVDWLWKNWLARGKLHVLAGKPTTGKTTAALSFAATLTRGGYWPDGTPAPVANVLIWSGEDALHDTVIPRLLAAGADMKRVLFVASCTRNNQSRAFDPSIDTDALSDHLASLDEAPALLIVDSIVSAVAGDSNQGGNVRRSLQPLVDMAELRGFAIVGITHFSKGTQGRDPLERVTGSLSFGAVPRLVMSTAKLPDHKGGGQMLVRCKNSNGPDSGGFRYDLELVEVPEHPHIMVTRTRWGAPLEGTARTLLNMAEAEEEPADDTQRQESDVEAFVRECLKDGAVPAQQMRTEAETAGYHWSKVDRTATRIGVNRTKEGYKAGWVWRLAMPQDDEERTEEVEGSTLKRVRSSISSRSSVRSSGGSDDEPETPEA